MFSNVEWCNKWIESGCPINTNVFRLQLSYNKSPYLLQIFLNFPNIKILDMSHSRIKSIPCEIGNCVNLMELNLSYNKFTSIPKEIGNCVNLTELNLSDSLLESIPESIGNCVNLKHLNVSRNRITSIPKEICNCINLNTIMCHSNLIVEIPKEIGNLKNLLFIYIYYNQLTSIPPEIGDCEKLEFIIFDGNQVSSIPIELFNCKNLYEIYANSNQITTIPPEIGNCLKLTTLQIHTNQLTSIPPEIGNCVNLDTLDISNNRLTFLPPSIGMIPYIRLDILGNPIEYIPPNIGRLLVKNIYNDSQSIHNSTVQQHIKKSIIRLISTHHTITSETIIENILSDDILTDLTKQSLIKYANSTGELIVELNLSFLDVLVAVWNRISINEHSSEIKKILNEEMADDEFKCFTGRVSRLVNCLTRFDELVEVGISDVEQIGAVISAIANQLYKEKRYTLELHREIISVELAERGYKKEIISDWVKYIV